MRISRRSAITATAAALVTAPALARLPADEDPHARLWAEYEIADKEVEKAIDLEDTFIRRPEDDPERIAARRAMEAAENHAYGILMELCQTPARTLQGLAVQASVLSWMQGFAGGWKGDADTYCADNLCAGLNRLAGAS